MRNYIFTQVEKKLIQNYLDTGTKVQDLYVLLNRIKASYPRLKEDMELLSDVLDKSNSELEVR